MRNGPGCDPARGRSRRAIRLALVRSLCRNAHARDDMSLVQLEASGVRRRRAVLLPGRQSVDVLPSQGGAEPPRARLEVLVLEVRREEIVGGESRE